MEVLENSGVTRLIPFVRGGSASPLRVLASLRERDRDMGRKEGFSYQRAKHLLVTLQQYLNYKAYVIVTSNAAFTTATTSTIPGDNKCDLWFDHVLEERVKEGTHSFREITNSFGSFTHTAPSSTNLHRISPQPGERSTSTTLSKGVKRRRFW